MPTANASDQDDAELAGDESLLINTAIQDNPSEGFTSSNSIQLPPSAPQNDSNPNSKTSASAKLSQAPLTRLEPKPVLSTTVSIARKSSKRLQPGVDHEHLSKYALYGFAVDHFTLVPPRSRFSSPFHQPKPFNLMARMTWEKELCSAPLTNKLKGEQIQIGLQAFRNISGFMGNRTSGKGQIDHCFKLLRNVMSRPVVIKDEIFCQLCKQLTGNPDANAALNGWLLLSACLVSFPPSPILAPFLERFLAGHVGSADDKAAKFAESCLASLYEWTNNGRTERQEIPSLVEIQSLRDHTTVAVIVLLIDGSSDSYCVNSWTSTGELALIVAERLGVTRTQAFSLFEISAGGDERRMDSNERVVDLLALWERVGVEKRPKKKKATSELSDVHHHLLYKVFLYVPLDDGMIGDLELVYKQAVHDIIRGIFVSSLQECVQLAAYQLYITHGPFPSIAKTFDFTRELPSFLPSHLISSANRDEIATRVQQVYSTLSGEGDDRVSAQQIRLAYLKLCGTIRLYGSTFFAVHNTRSRTMPPELVLAVNYRGIAIVNVANDAVLHQFPYVSIATWGYSSNAFVFVVSTQGGDAEDVEYVLKTKAGKAINEVVAAYVAFILASSSTSGGDKIS